MANLVVENLELVTAYIYMRERLKFCVGSVTESENWKTKKRISFILE
jgi:hypothetical protein